MEGEREKEEGIETHWEGVDTRQYKEKASEGGDAEGGREEE